MIPAKADVSPAPKLQVTVLLAHHTKAWFTSSIVRQTPVSQSARMVELATAQISFAINASISHITANVYLHAPVAMWE